MKVNLGIVGFGEFSKGFVEIYTSHPDINRVVGAELIKERRDDIKKEFNL